MSLVGTRPPTVDEWEKGHRSSAVNGVFIAAGRAKTTFASKGDKFKITAVSTTVHSTTKSGTRR